MSRDETCTAIAVTELAGRPSRRRLRGIGAAAASVLCAGLILGCSAADESSARDDDDEAAVDTEAGLGLAGLAPASIVNVESDDHYNDVTGAGDTVFFARTTPRTSLDPQRWWLRVDVTIKNNGAAPLTLTSFTVDTDVGSPEDKPLVTPVNIPAFGSKVVVVPGGLAGDEDRPAVLGIRAKFAEYSDPIQRNVNVVAFESNTPTGGYRFPFKPADFTDELFIHVGAHDNSVNQKWALDIGGRRWNEDLGKWDSLKKEAYLHADPGSLNSDYLIWDMPIYAIASGTVRRCTRSLVDHSPGGGSKGGNTVILELGNGEWVAYHHLKQNSIPASLCPVEGGSDANWFPLAIPVVSGQFLGRVGDTGASGGPHLHMQITGEPPSPLTEEVARPLPINFFRIMVHHSDGYDPGGNISGFVYVGDDQPLALHSNTLVKPTF